MKRLLLGLCLAAGLGFVGCEKSVESEMKDVNDAKKEAVENIKEEQRDLQDTVEAEKKKVLEEQREAQDAKVREGLAPPTTVTPGTP